MIVDGGPNTGPVAFAMGRYRYAYPASFERTRPAAVAALEDLKCRVRRQKKDLHGGTIKAVRANGERIRLRLEPESRGITNLTIRVGPLGERKFSELIHERILKLLDRES